MVSNFRLTVTLEELHQENVFRRVMFHVTSAFVRGGFPDWKFYLVEEYSKIAWLVTLVRSIRRMMFDRFDSFGFALSDIQRGIC